MEIAIFHIYLQTLISCTYHFSFSNVFICEKCGEKKLLQLLCEVLCVSAMLCLLLSSSKNLFSSRYTNSSNLLDGSLHSLYIMSECQ